MNIFQAIILGIVQGLTEFLPVSSSGHLALITYFAGWDIPEVEKFTFDVLVHWGTLLAVIVYFWKDIVRIVLDFVAGCLKGQPFVEAQSRMGWFILLATVPAGIAGLLLKKWIEAAFTSPVAVALFLMVTAALLVAAEFIGKRTRNLNEMYWKDALWIGLFQMIALLPGISRSGATITGASVRNFERTEAARFSFLLSIPIIVAAGLYQLKDFMEFPALAVIDSLPVVLTGTIVAAVVGYFSIRWLLSFLKNNSLVWFSGYCFMVGALVLFISFYFNR
jgi:undecaprenyl-diphosphatase